MSVLRLIVILSVAALMLPISLLIDGAAAARPLGMSWNGHPYPALTGRTPYAQASRWATCPMTSQLTPAAAPSGLSFLDGMARGQNGTAWAVGFRVAPPPSNDFSSLALRESSPQWLQAGPSSPTDARFDGITASAGQFWAVGSSGTNPLVERWSRGKWSVLPAKEPVGTIATLYGTASTSAHDVWAVGWSQTGGLVDETKPRKDVLSSTLNQTIGGKTLIEHWNGKKWSISPSSNPSATFNALTGVVALSPTNVWTVGAYFTSRRRRWAPLVQHWNGRTWRTAGLPVIPGVDASLESIAGDAGSLWAVGYTAVGGPQTRVPLILRHTNSGWRRVIGPALYAQLDTVAVHDREVVAGGYYERADKPEALSLIWDGNHWQLVNVVVPRGAIKTSIEGLALTPTGEAIGVGTANYPGNKARPLIERLRCVTT